MATINGTKGSGNQSFKQLEGDSWSSIYLPAICAAIVMTIVLLMAISCSKKSDKPISSGISAPAPTVNSSPAAGASTVIAEAPKKIKKHRPANATYVNGTYGVSFSYPRKYSLQTASKNSAMPVDPKPLASGAVEVVSVDMPDDSYPDTDFSSALLNVSVNPGLSSDQCSAFVSDAKDPQAKVQRVKLGANEFAEIEQMSNEPNHESDLKYFHLFKNGACYEFALEVETSRPAEEDLAQTDRGKVFQQLEKILTTARIKDVEVPGALKPVEAAKSETPQTPAAAHSALTEQK